MQVSIPLVSHTWREPGIPEENPIERKDFAVSLRQNCDNTDNNFRIIVLCIALILTGPGAYALDHAIGVDALGTRLLHFPV